MKFKNKYLIVKWDDLEQGLSNGEQEILAKLMRKVNQFRVNQGKEPAKARLVINCDEPYATTVALLMATHGHCEADRQIGRIEIVW